jgi:ribosome-binding protein aMBF1 (putative translation factor)
MSVTNKPQQWDPVFLHGNKGKTQNELIRTKEVTTVAKNKQPNKTSGPTVLSAKKANDYDPEHVEAPATSSIDLGRAIQAARSEKDPKWTQDDLNNKCSFPKNTIRNYENGTATVDPSQLDKMNRVLGVTLPRPKK